MPGALGNDFLASRPAPLESYIPELYRFLLRRLHGVQDARDLLQDIFVRFLAVPRRDKILQPERYLYRIAANLVSEYSLRQRRSRVIFDSDRAEKAFSTQSPGATWRDDPGETLQVQQQLQQAMSRLPPMYRTVLLLWGREGLPPAQIADKLGLTLMTTRKYLSHAIAEIRAMGEEL